MVLGNLCCKLLLGSVAQLRHVFSEPLVNLRKTCNSVGLNSPADGCVINFSNSEMKSKTNQPNNNKNTGSKEPHFNNKVKWKSLSREEMGFSLP